jgi:hypothetical protein
LARSYPETGFVYAGPVAREALSTDQQQSGGLLYFHNVAALSPLPPRICRRSIGTVPMLTENGFPVKALEMAVTRFPVVSTLMKPLPEIADAVTVVQTVRGDRRPQQLRLKICPGERSE